MFTKRKVTHRGETRFELILLFDRLKLEPKKLHEWLKARNQNYSYYTIKKYHGYYASSDMIARTIMGK